MIYHYDKLIIGGTLPAYCCAWCNQYPIIHIADESREPQPWDCFPADIDWIGLHFPRQDRGLITNLGIHSKGLQKKLLYTRLATILALSGKTPFAGDITSIEVDREKKRIILGLNNNRTVQLSYNKLYVFDGANVVWDLVPVKQNNWYSVTDWFVLSRTTPSSLDVLFDKDDNPFVWRIFWYLSDRVDHAWKSVVSSQYFKKMEDESCNCGVLYIQRDICSVSFLTEKQLADTNYSEAMARLKTKRMLRAAHITGSFNWARKGVRYHKPFVLEFQKRDVRPVWSSVFENVDDIKFLYWNDDIAYRFLLRYINHTDLTTNINNRLFADFLIEHGKHKARLQRFEVAATILNWSESKGKQLSQFPKEVAKWHTENLLNR